MTTEVTRDTLSTIMRTAIGPALALLPPQMQSIRALIMMLAIGMQESRFAYRAQIVRGHPYIKGPARGLWQFEEGTQAGRGGVWGVFLHDASRFWLAELCRKRNVPFVPREIWLALERDDVLAAGVARLLLFTDPKRLPEPGDVEGAWGLYAYRCWRPGKPHRHTWDGFYRQACEFVAEAA